MKPPVKKLLKMAGALGVVGGVGMLAAAYALSRPGVQRSLALEALKQAGWSGDVRSVTVTFGGDLGVEEADFTDVHGRRVACSRATGKVSWGGFVFGIPHIHRLDAEGVDVDLAGTASPGVPGAAGPAGIPGGVEVPKWHVDAASMSGRVVMPGAGAWRGQVRLSDYRSARGGKVVFDVARDAAGGLRLSGDARVKLSGAMLAGDLRRVWRGLKPEVEAEFEARPAADSPVALRVKLSADIGRAVLRATTEGGGAVLQAVLPELGPVTVSGDWLLRREAFTPWVSAMMPTGDSRGRITASVDPATGEGVLSANLAGEATGVPAGYDGPRALEAVLEVARTESGVVELRRIRGTVTAAGPSPAIKCELGGVTLDPASGWTPGGLPGRVAELSVREMPSSWLNPLLAHGGVTLVGGVVSTEVRAELAATGTLSLQTVSPLLLSAREVLRTGRPVASSLALAAPLVCSRDRAGAIRVETRGATLALSDAPVARADAEWVGRVAGGGLLDFSTHLLTGAFPHSGLPDAVCEFCTDTGAEVTFTGRLRHAPGTATLEQGAGELRTRAGVPVASVEVLRPLGTGGVPADSLPVAHASFKGAPLAFFAPLCGGGRPEGLVESGDLSLSLTGAGWRVLRPVSGAPLVVRGLGWTDAAARIQLAPTDVRADIQWAQTPGGWRLSLADLRAGTPGREALSGRLALDWAGGPRALDCDLAGDLPALRQQLPRVGLPDVTAGHCRLAGQGGVAGRGTFRFLAEGLRSRATEGASSLSVTWDSDFAPGTRSLRLPLRFEGRSGVTTALATAEASLADGRWRWAGSLHGGKVYLDDWLALFGKSAAGPASPPAAGPDGARPDPLLVASAADWAGHVGTFGVDFADVYAAGEHFAQPALALSLTDSALVADRLSARWRDLPVAGAGALRHTPARVNPYQLTGSVAVAGLPLGRVIESVAPKAAGWVEGDFDAKLSLEAEAPVLDALPGQARVRLDAASRGGTLRFFKADNEAVRITGDMVELAGELAGDIGILLGSSNPYVGELVEASAVLRKALTQVRYDACSLTAERLPDGALSIPAMALESETLRVSGQGRLGRPGAVGFFTRHADIEARVDTRGEVTRALVTLGRSDGVEGPGGWAGGPVLHYDGALDNLRNNLLNNLFRAVSVPAADAPPASGVNRLP